MNSPCNAYVYSDISDGRDDSFLIDDCERYCLWDDCFIEFIFTSKSQSNLVGNCQRNFGSGIRCFKCYVTNFCKPIHCLSGIGKKISDLSLLHIGDVYDIGFKHYQIKEIRNKSILLFDGQYRALVSFVNFQSRDVLKLSQLPNTNINAAIEIHQCLYDSNDWQLPNSKRFNKKLIMEYVSNFIINGQKFLSFQDFSSINNQCGFRALSHVIGSLIDVFTLKQLIKFYVLKYQHRFSMYFVDGEVSASQLSATIIKYYDSDTSMMGVVDIQVCSEIFDFNYCVINQSPIYSSSLSRSFNSSKICQSSNISKNNNGGKYWSVSHNSRDSLRNINYFSFVPFLHFVRLQRGNKVAHYSLIEDSRCKSYMNNEAYNHVLGFIDSVNGIVGVSGTRKKKYQLRPKISRTLNHDILTLDLRGSIGKVVINNLFCPDLPDVDVCIYFTYMFIVNSCKYI